MLIDLGDTGDFDSISRFNKGRPRKEEGKRLLKDIQIVQKVENTIFACAPKAKKRKHKGNHEERLDRYLDENPVVEGMLEGFFDNKDFPVEIIEHGKFSSIGKLMSHHGDRRGYISIHHAKQWASIGRSIIYGHHHGIQRFTHETLHRNGKPDKHAAFAIGCLCLLERDWMSNQKSLWQQSLGLAYFADDGYFNLYNVDITNRRAIWNGKLYKG